MSNLQEPYYFNEISFELLLIHINNELHCMEDNKVRNHKLIGYTLIQWMGFSQIL